MYHYLSCIKSHLISERREGEGARREFLFRGIIHNVSFQFHKRWNVSLRILPWLLNASWTKFNAPTWKRSIHSRTTYPALSLTLSFFHCYIPDTTTLALPSRETRYLKCKNGEKGKRMEKVVERERMWTEQWEFFLVMEIEGKKKEVSRMSWKEEERATVPQWNHSSVNCDFML